MIWVIYRVSNVSDGAHNVSHLLSLHTIGKSCFLSVTSSLHRHSLSDNHHRKSTLNSTKKYIHRWRLSKQMSHEHILSLSTLSIELVYRILNQLTHYEILISVCNVCSRLNCILDTYQPYQVKITRFIFKFSRRIDSLQLVHNHLLRERQKTTGSLR